MSEIANFETLVTAVREISMESTSAAKGAVNRMMTIRNWLLGAYIVEYEQNGSDRAAYGEHLLENLENKTKDIKGLNATMFRYCRRFYTLYPQMISVIPEGHAKQLPVGIRTTVLSESVDGDVDNIQTTVLSEFKIPAEMLLNKLSFSHIKEILRRDDPLERFFYELECIKCGWSVRELARQIDSQLYFRAGISKNPKALLTSEVADPENPAIPLRDPYVFEFLGLNASETISESDLEQAIMDHLQEFLLEMGKGFCFEARQKRILIDDEYFFIDLVLYNRILHCNVIIELKTGKFKLEYPSQLNAYVSYYKFEEMNEGDNPPVGILLCTEQGPKMVQYVLNGMDENLFTSTYMLQLPNKEQLEEFLIKEVKELGI